MKFFTCNLSTHFGKCQSFETNTKLKKLILAKISHIPQMSHIILCRRTMFELYLTQTIFGVISLKTV